MRKILSLPFVLILTLIMNGCTGPQNHESQSEITGKMELKEEKINAQISLFSITNDKGMTVKVTNYGGIIQSLFVPDRDGSVKDIVLGFESIPRYQGDHPYFGAIVGRYANRIKEGRFTLDGKEYQLTINNGPHHLHGGVKGLDKAIWDAAPFSEEDSAGVVLRYSSPAGDQGYPGRLDIKVIYIVNNDNELKIDYSATTTEATPVNITNHSYFNLTGDPSRDILGHHLMIDADHYTAVDEELIPNGELRAVEGTPFDFRKPTTIGSRMHEVEGGYDHNFALNQPGEMRKVVEVSEPSTGIRMEISTTEPGVQFYTGNFLDGSITGKYGIVYQKHAGFCLETQHYPDSPNQPGFPGVILEPGDVYHQATVYKFSARK